MEQKTFSAVEKRKVISASKLKPIQFVPSRLANSKRPSSNEASMESDIASISFSHSHPSINASVQRADYLTLDGSSSSKNLSALGNPASERVNPFNRVADTDSDSSSSDSRLSSSSHDTGMAELGLMENHFSYREGHLGLSSVEELETAILNCKSMILKLPEDSKKKKKLVEKLVQLRVQLQDIKDKPRTSSSNTKVVLGHYLKKNKGSLKTLCDCCKSSIWGLLQVWYQCKECSYICHEKCLDNIRRSCVANLAKTAKYDLNICPEVGLSKQIYCCRECKNPIMIGGGSDAALICDYTGYYYCDQCHWGDLMVIPARVVHNWDHTPRKVCRHSHQLLNKMYHLPVLDIEEVNPKLFNYVEELAEIRRMREDILKMKQYLLTCSAAREAKLFWDLEEWQHFLDNSNMYSMKDLVDTHSGHLTEELARIHISYGKHIKLDCLICQAKGFICEICNSGETLFPFDLAISICPTCAAVFHEDCFSFQDRMCPRCRRKRDKRNRSISRFPDSDDEDVLSSPDVTEVSPYSSWVMSHQTKQSEEGNSEKREEYSSRDSVPGSPERLINTRERSAAVLTSPGIARKPLPMQVNNEKKTNIPEKREETFVNDSTDSISSNITYNPPPVVASAHHHSGIFTARERSENIDVSNPFSVDLMQENPFSDGVNATNPFADDVNKGNPFVADGEGQNPFCDDVQENQIAVDETNPFAEDIYENSNNPFCQ